MTNSDLQAIGIYLYGVRWKRPLARETGIAESAISAWLRDHPPIPEKPAARILALARAKGWKGQPNNVDALATEIRGEIWD